MSRSYAHVDLLRTFARSGTYHLNRACLAELEGAGLIWPLGDEWKLTAFGEELLRKKGKRNG